MDTTLWIALGIAIAVAAGYLVVMRASFVKARRRSSASTTARFEYGKTTRTRA
jgi:hypothetical protein